MDQIINSLPCFHKTLECREEKFSRGWCLIENSINGKKTLDISAYKDIRSLEIALPLEFNHPAPFSRPDTGNPKPLTARAALNKSSCRESPINYNKAAWNVNTPRLVSGCIGLSVLSRCFRDIDVFRFHAYAFSLHTQSGSSIYSIQRGSKFVVATKLGRLYGSKQDENQE